MNSTAKMEGKNKKAKTKKNMNSSAVRIIMCGLNLSWLRMQATEIYFPNYFIIL
jgi:hypothetical protein